MSHRQRPSLTQPLPAPVESEPYNIIPIHNLLVDHPSLRFPEVRAVTSTLRAVGDLRKPPYGQWAPHMDLLDWLPSSLASKMTTCRTSWSTWCSTWPTPRCASRLPLTTSMSSTPPFCAASARSFFATTMPGAPTSTRSLTSGFPIARRPPPPTTTASSSMSRSKSLLVRGKFCEKTSSKLLAFSFYLFVGDDEERSMERDKGTKREMGERENINKKFDLYKQLICNSAYSLFNIR